MACHGPYVGPEGVRGICRKCEDCKQRWLRNWTGRLMAEHAMSVETWFSTFTYGGGYDNPAAYHLDKRHLRVMYDRLNRRGFRFKPFAAGEHGSKGDRAHWHIILFWKNEPPKALFENDQAPWEYTDDRGLVKRWWDHGNVFHKVPEHHGAAMAYVLKYLDKPDKGTFSYGKRPAIGETFLVQRARQLAQAGKMLFPKRTPTYQVPGNVKDVGEHAGQPYDYWLDTNSAMYERMIQAYVVSWLENWPGRRMAPCQFIQGWAQGLGGLARQALVPTRSMTHLASVEAMIFGGPRHDAQSLGQALEFHSVSWDDEVTLVRDRETGAMELRLYDEEGEIEWRHAIEGVDVDAAKSRPVQVRLPGDSHPGRRTGLLTPGGRRRGGESR